MFSDLLQRDDGGKKAVGGLEDIQLRGKEEQHRKEQQARIGRLAVLRPGQKPQYSIVAADAQRQEKNLRRQKQQIQQRISHKLGKERRLHRIDDPEGEL